MSLDDYFSQRATTKKPVTVTEQAEKPAAKPSPAAPAASQGPKLVNLSHKEAEKEQAEAEAKKAAPSWGTQSHQQEVGRKKQQNFPQLGEEPQKKGSKKKEASKKSGGSTNMYDVLRK